MAINDYHFITHWRVRSTCEEIMHVLADGAGLVRWWPAVYLDVTEIKKGDERGIGTVIDLYTKGWLPYTLRWQFTVTESDYPTHLALAAKGDFDGRGIWTFKQDGPWVDITYDWKITAEKPLLRNLSFVIKPIFKANHLWAMRKGEESLNLELARRHAATPEVRVRIPAPPLATPKAILPWLGYVLSHLGASQPQPLEETPA